MLARLKSRARALKIETYAIYIAALDPRTPWYAQILILLIVAYALSPIDLIPDFVPVLGYFDDLLIVPAGIALAMRLIPLDVLEESRKKAGSQSPPRIFQMIGLGIIAIIWILAIIVITSFIKKLIGNAP
jgi:uncharacterized membrane protein YkvA (DUF1232 family)